jgi:phage gpG-like protein
MSKITIDVLTKDVTKKLNDLEKASGNVTPAMQVVGRKIKTKVQLGFRLSRDPWGSPWKPLNKNLTRSGQPLRNTGHLLNSMTYKVGGTSGDQHVDVGTNLQSKGVLFPAVHQFGAVIKAKNAKYLRWMGPHGPIKAKQVTIPARPFLPLAAGSVDMPQEWSVDILTALYNHFDKAAKK